MAPELDPELHIAHCITPDSLDAALRQTPGAVGATAVSPTYFGAVADIEGLAEVAHAHGVPLIVDEAWGAHFPFHADLPAPALSLGADLVVSSTHKVVGSLTQAAMVHVGEDSLLDDELVDRCVTLLESTSPSSLLTGSLDAARRLAVTRRARSCCRARSPGWRSSARAVRELPGLDVLDERLVGAPGVHEYDPLRVAIDVRGTGAPGYDLARALREEHDILMELAGENVMVAVFGMAEDVAAAGGGSSTGCATRSRSLPGPEHAAARHSRPPPPWGELVMTPGRPSSAPRRSCRRRRPSAGWPPSRWPPTRRGFPTCCRASGSRPRRSSTSRRRSTHGGSLRGASDRELRTIRAVCE